MTKRFGGRVQRLVISNTPLSGEVTGRNGLAAGPWCVLMAVRRLVAETDATLVTCEPVCYPGPAQFLMLTLMAHPIVQKGSLGVTSLGKLILHILSTPVSEFFTPTRCAATLARVLSHQPALSQNNSKKTRRSVSTCSSWGCGDLS